MPAYNRVTRSILSSVLIYLQIKKRIRKFLCFKHILLKVKIDIGLQIHKLYINAIISSVFFIRIYHDEQLESDILKILTDQTKKSVVQLIEDLCLLVKQ